MVTIYALAEPSGEIRYVGKTHTSVKKRYNQHIYNWQRSTRRHVDCWIKSLYHNGLRPELIVLDEVDEIDWIFWEQYWIQQCRVWGFNLCNHTIGGEGTIGYKPSEESKRKRLKTLETSTAWKERSVRHSQIIKKLHDEGVSFGYGHLSEYERKKIGENHSVTMSERFKIHPEHKDALIKGRIIPVEQLNDIGEVITTFESASAAGRHFKIDGTHVTRVCKGKSTHTHGLFFRYKTLIAI